MSDLVDFGPSTPEGEALLARHEAMVERIFATGIRPFDSDFDPYWWWNREADDPENWLLEDAIFPETKRDIRAYKKALWEDRCAYCGEKVEVLDHIQPKSRGGSDEWDNFTGACTACNLRKSAKSVLGLLGGEKMRPDYDAARVQFSGWAKL